MSALQSTPAQSAQKVRGNLSCKHSGFNVHAGDPVPPEHKAELEQLAQYILRNPFSVQKMTMESPTDTIIYRSKLNPKINRNFQVFTPTDFLAAITQHIPDKGAQMVRYYGWYSNKMRGQRHRAENGGAASAPLRPPCTPPPPAKLPAKKWRDLILKVWHTDPLICPNCQHPMRVIAVIDQRTVVEKSCGISSCGTAHPCWPQPAPRRTRTPGRGSASRATTWIPCPTTKTS